MMKDTPHKARKYSGRTGGADKCIANATSIFETALARATVKGFYGEVRVSVTLQDGSVQN
jgi:hypothetical protein